MVPRRVRCSELPAATDWPTTMQCLALRTLRLLQLPLLVGLLAWPACAEPAATNDQRRTILVVGDSISASYGMAMEEGWVNLLRQKLAGSARVVNASITGDTTAGGLARLPKTLAVHRPDVVVIELGGNDGLRGYPLRHIRENLLAMTREVTAVGAKPVLAGMRLPPSYGRYAESFHRIYFDIAAALNVPLVPFLLEGVATDEELMQRDGIHPSADAQPMLLDNLWPVLAQVLD